MTRKCAECGREFEQVTGSSKINYVRNYNKEVQEQEQLFAAYESEELAEQIDEAAKQNNVPRKIIVERIKQAIESKKRLPIVIKFNSINEQIVLTRWKIDQRAKNKLLTRSELKYIRRFDKTGFLCDNCITEDHKIIW